MGKRFYCNANEDYDRIVYTDKRIGDGREVWVEVEQVPNAKVLAFKKDKAKTGKKNRPKYTDYELYQKYALPIIKGFEFGVYSLPRDMFLEESKNNELKAKIGEWVAAEKQGETLWWLKGNERLNTAEMLKRDLAEGEKVRFDPYMAYRETEIPIELLHEHFEEADISEIPYASQPDNPFYLPRWKDIFAEWNWGLVEFVGFDTFTSHTLKFDQEDAEEEDTEKESEKN